MARKPYEVREATTNKAGYSGACTHCGNAAKKEAVFKEDGINVIEKYCDACMEPKVFERLQEIYSRVS